VSTWRKWVSPIVLIIVLAALALAGWWGYKALTNPLATPKEPACVTQTVGEALTTKQVTVNVYNGGATTGLAKSVSTKLATTGFKIGAVANAKNGQKVTKTTIVGATSTDPEVKLVAGFFPGAVVQGDGRKDHSVDVVLPTGASTISSTAPTQIGAPGGVVCLPTPTPVQTPKQISKSPAASATTSKPA